MPFDTLHALHYCCVRFCHSLMMYIHSLVIVNKVMDMNEDQSVLKCVQ